MTRPYAPGYRIPPELLLKAYASGVFPMAESATDPEVFWVRPETRGIIPLDGLHVPRSLAKTVRQARFEVRFDHHFEAVSTPARKRGRSAEAPGSTRRSVKPMSSSTAAATAIRWNAGATAGSPAASTG